MKDEAEMATLDLIAGGGRPTPYLLLAECDGRPDHNLFHLENQISCFELFIVGNMEKLVETRGCTGLSYLKTAERAMDILNIELLGLEL